MKYALPCLSVVSDGIQARYPPLHAVDVPAFLLAARCVSRARRNRLAGERLIVADKRRLELVRTLLRPSG